eukprot:gnl/Carplike_NY0171/1620_a2188_358.p1 GENE.gnl/Carplike_NY0171/1620_a2188_358~~gnl/Carplike_NY0171/1620_a2188_358.p1  ORF type:complete len:197 (-),score=14.13 gnl/Carplike_NY0171/1620_a2188_358:483-1073(-)
MDYNSKRKKLPLPEYGRNIQNMVDHVMTIENREERNRAAKTVIDVMGNLYPYLRDVAEFNHKLWDHLAIMTDFKLDIDYPFEPPSPSILTEKPNKVPYNQHNIKYKHYGLVMEKMVQKIPEFEGEEKEVLTKQLANHMKKSFLLWNKDAVEDEKIFMDLEEISEGTFKMNPEMQLADIKTLIGKPKKKKLSNKKKR